MTEAITLELPESVLEKARTEAKHSEQTLEHVLTAWLEYAATSATVHTIYTPVGSYEAAQILEQMLREHQASKRNSLPSAFSVS